MILEITVAEESRRGCGESREKAVQAEIMQFRTRAVALEMEKKGRIQEIVGGRITRKWMWWEERSQ